MTGSPEDRPCVLVVDDNQALREQLAELLPEFGIRVAGAVARGEQVVPAVAAALAAGDRVNVVVMDVRMPGIGGLAATRQVRAVFPEVQVLLHTAYGGHLEQQAHQVGAFAEVAKGADIRALIDLIWRACQARRTCDDPAPERRAAATVWPHPRPVTRGGIA